jgi:hypothetical protein
MEQGHAEHRTDARESKVTLAGSERTGLGVVQMRQGPGYAAMLSIAIGLTACATIQSAQQQDWLTQAGFIRVDMRAPQFAAIAPPLPAHRFARRTVNGSQMVFFADPINCNCTYAGSPAAYATYKQQRSDIHDIAAFDEPPPSQ